MIGLGLHLYHVQRYSFCQSIKISLASPLQSFFRTFERFLQLNWNFLFNKSFSNSASKIQTEIYIIKISLRLIRSVLVQWLAFQPAAQKVWGSNPGRSKFLFPQKCLMKTISMEKKTCSFRDQNPRPSARQVANHYTRTD